MTPSKVSVRSHCGDCPVEIASSQRQAEKHYLERFSQAGTYMVQEEALDGPHQISRRHFDV